MSDQVQSTEDLRRLVERVVKEVLDGKTANSAEANGSEPQHNPPIIPFDGTVLTAKIAEQYPRNQVVRIGPRAVVTPSAVEILKDRRIRWVRGSIASRAQGTLVADADGLRRCATVSRQLTARGYEGTRGCGVKDLVARVVQDEQENRENQSLSVHLVIAQSPQEAVWNIYRATGACVAQVCTRDDPWEIVGNLQPRVWILDARHVTVGALVQLADRCLSASSSFRPTATQKGDGG